MIPVRPFQTVLKWNEAQHPRVSSGSHAGEFTEKPAGDHAPATEEDPAEPLTPAQEAMQRQLAEQDQKPIHQVHTPEEAVEHILAGDNVELQDTKHVHTVLKKLADLAIASKEKPITFDPCTITVKGVSIFCTEKLRTKKFPHGIPRIEMPQFKSKNPVPGSEADQLPRSNEGEVDATSVFIDHLRQSGVTVIDNGMMLARKLKASQAQMEGTKVAGMMVHPTRDPKTAKIIVTSDGYVLDGHHTWAASVGRDAEDGNLDNDKEMDVVIVDMPMSKVYHAAVAWTKAYGLPAAGIKKREKTMSIQPSVALKFNPYHGRGGLFMSRDRVGAGNARSSAEHAAAATHHHAEADRHLVAYYKASIRSQSAKAAYHEAAASSHRDAARAHEEASRSHNAAQSGLARQKSQEAFAKERSQVLTPA